MIDFHFSPTYFPLGTASLSISSARRSTYGRGKAYGHANGASSVCSIYCSFPKLVYPGLPASSLLASCFLHLRIASFGADLHPAIRLPFLARLAAKLAF